MPIRLMLVDDHLLVRAGLKRILDAVADFEVVAEAGEAREVLQRFTEGAVDVVLVDVALPGLNGLELCRELCARDPAARVVMVSMHADEAYVLRALESGASGYVLKHAGAEDLEAAVRAARAGRRYLSPEISEDALRAYADRVGSRSGGLDLLTPRQREVLQLVAEGLTSKEIAARLNVSLKTVETHRSHIMERLDIHDLAGLVRFAIDQGLVIATE